MSACAPPGHCTTQPPGYAEPTRFYLSGVGQVEGDDVQGLVGGQQLAQVGGDGGKDDAVGAQDVAVVAPEGEVGVEATLQALAGLAGHVLVQVLAVHPQHRRHPHLCN